MGIFGKVFEDKDLKIRRLLKEATDFGKANNHEEAIKCLTTANRLMKASATSYPIETYLRLPLYLQKAGRWQESLTEFQQLAVDTFWMIESEFKHQPPEIRDSLRAMQLSIIHDKIRVAAKRQKDAELVLMQGILCHANRCVGLMLQKRKKELAALNNPETWNELIDELSPKGLRHLAPQLLDLCISFSKLTSLDAVQALTRAMEPMVVGALRRAGEPGN